MVEIIAVVISGISLLIVIINQFKMIKDKEPQISFNLRSIDHNINNIHKSTLRLANYFDGNEIAPFDELNIVSGNHFQKDLKNEKEGKKSTVKSRKKVIESRIR